MKQRFLTSLHASFERAFPEQRLFLRTATRFIRLSPMTQFVGLTGSALLIGWTIVASAILLIHGLGAGDLKEQALREQALYEGRLNKLASERDARAAEAAEAHKRFSVALAEVSAMQSRLLASEERRRELQVGLDVVQDTLRQAMNERDEAFAKSESLLTKLEETEATNVEAARLTELEGTLDFLSAALGNLAVERDEMAGAVSATETRLDEMLMASRLDEERNARIFQQIEDAVTNSLDPIDEMFSSVGLPTDSIIEQLRRTYSGQGGPLTPIRFTTSGETASDPTSIRAGEVLDMLDELTLYRIAAEKLPFGFPVRGTYRSTSGFGPRWGRMHEGHDWAGPRGTPIHSTADGVVTFAGRQSGYGNMIKIRHDFGFETRYAHLSRIRVEVGQRVSRGERIGDMGNTGRSTGTHLHYEVRVGGKPVNPMKYIKAARDVF